MIYDCIVVGFGGVGSAALRSAALRGWNVLGLDRFGPAHDRGSSHGQTRIIRRAYFEHPSYVPLACRAFEMWDELNNRHRTSIEIKPLLTTCGLLQVGRETSEVIRGVQASAQQHGLTVETFSPSEIERRLPIFKIQDDEVGLFEPDAGFLRVELCVAAAINQAIKHGAEVRSNTIVQRWEVQDDGTVEVITDQGVFRGRRLVVAGGAWSEQLLPELKLDLRILQKQQHWFQLDRVDQKIENNFPAFLFENADGSVFYGLPEIDYLGMKIAEHSGGTALSSPGEIDRSLNEFELARVEGYLQQRMHFNRLRMVHHSACMYTMSPDQHFIIDRYPGLENVSFAAGLSGPRCYTQIIADAIGFHIL